MDYRNLVLCPCKRNLQFTDFIMSRKGNIWLLCPLHVFLVSTAEHVSEKHFNSTRRIHWTMTLVPVKHYNKMISGDQQCYLVKPLLLVIFCKSNINICKEIISPFTVVKYWRQNNKRVLRFDVLFCNERTIYKTNKHWDSQTRLNVNIHHRNCVAVLAIKHVFFNKL